MMSLKSFQIPVILLGILLFFAQCNKPGPDYRLAEFNNLTGLDGCGWVLIIENDNYEPVNLNDFSITPQQGKKVWVKYQHVEMMTICMVGPTIQLQDMQPYN